jgi:alpha-tubulin suppressor-like RCC1 family protein
LRAETVPAATGSLADGNGQVVAWGYNAFGQTTIPTGAFTAIAAGNEHSLGILSDGTLAGGGYNISGQTTVPAGTFTTISARGNHSLGRRVKLVNA